MSKTYNIENQEKSLDYAEGILKNVLKQIRNDLSSYRGEDIKNLEHAIVALNKVTLRTDI
jgi:hypothetical protein